MNKQTKGALALLSTSVVWLLLSWQADQPKGYLVFGMVLAGQLSMWLVLALAQREERLGAKRKGLVAALLFLFPGLARAIIAIAIGIGIGVGLLGWAAIAIWSKALSIKLNELKKPIILDQRVENTNGVQVVVNTYPHTGPYDPVVQLAAAAAPAVSEPWGIHIMVPANMTLEYSTNMMTWGPIHYSGAQDEDTWWIPEGPQGFFRLKADSEPVPDPTR